MKRLLCLIGIHYKPKNNVGYLNVFCDRCVAGEMLPVSTHYHDCLSGISDWKVPCYDCDGDGQYQWIGPLDVEVENCPMCEGSGRVLDPRFKELRIEGCPHAFKDHQEGYYCLGYEVKHDLSILLSIVVNEFNNVLLTKAVLLSLYLETAKLNTTPEAILHAVSMVVHQWLIDQEKLS